MKAIKMSFIVPFYVSSFWNTFHMFYLFLLLYFFLFLQAVETNLASKDSHWVYVNEVRKSKETTQLGTFTHHHLWFHMFRHTKLSTHLTFLLFEWYKMQTLWCHCLSVSAELTQVEYQRSKYSFQYTSQQLGDFIFTFTLTLLHQLFRKQRVSQKKPQKHASMSARISPFAAVKACTQTLAEQRALRLDAGFAHSNMRLHDTQVFSSAECVAFWPRSRVAQI